MKSVPESLTSRIRQALNSRTIAIASEDGYEFVPVNQIIRCEGWEKYTKVHLSDGRIIVSSYNLGVYKEKLNSFHFFLSHKSHLVNDRHLAKYMKEGILIMSDGSSVPVSRRKKEEFLQFYVRRNSDYTA